jgi:hypothetical protein
MLTTNETNDLRPAGACTLCRVVFFARPDQVTDTRALIRLHESICPGGERLGEVALPYEPLPPPRLADVVPTMPFGRR